MTMVLLGHNSAKPQAKTAKTERMVLMAQMAKTDKMVPMDSTVKMVTLCSDL